LWLLVPLLAWFATRKRAQAHHLTIWHNSALAVSFWEELLFRGLIYGGVVSATHSALAAIIVSSLLFGLFHLRNLWWAPRKQVLINCLYTGLLIGPLLALVRWWTGDLYLCIALHAIHNFASLITSTHRIPTDNFLLSRQDNMNWFERLFSGLWLKEKQ
jgi:membrane protease YdiL (CAAX protease family)